MNFIVKSIIFISFITFFDYTVNAQLIVEVKPAGPKVVVVKPAKPGTDYIWIDGHWKVGPNKTYVWEQGSWVKMKHGRNWVSGHWEKVRRGYKWIPGHWEKVKLAKMRR